MNKENKEIKAKKINPWFKVERGREFRRETITPRGDSIRVETVRDGRLLISRRSIV